MFQACAKIAVIAFAWLWIVAGGAPAARPQAKARNDFVLSTPVGSASGIRFFYYSGGDVIPGPLILRPVQQGSPQLNTATAGKDELTTYVSFDEMSRVMARLTQMDLQWKESKKVQRFEPFSIFDEPSDKLDIEVVSSNGTAKAKLDGSLACQKLGALDSVFQTHRALLEFQAFRHWMGCEISGFNPTEYVQMVQREHKTNRK